MKSCVLLGLSSLLIGCATPRMVSPVPLAGQTINYQHGQPTIVSHRRNAALIGLLTPQSNGAAMLFVGVRNNSRQAFNFGTENISADSNGQALQVFRYEDLARQVQSSQTWSNVAIALGAAGQSVAANQPSRTYVQGNVYGYGGQQLGSYNAYGTTYDPARAQAAQAAINAQAQARSAQVAAETQASMAQLNNVLRTTTLNPGQIVGGLVEVSTNGASGTFNVRANIGGEQHVFSFQISQ